ncbi:hypothetical protein [Treponema sp.]|uniref:hypothetical protein n=1 Tax=Treponema sp. TaxID=166 RepID=UPI003FA1A76F
MAYIFPSVQEYITGVILPTLPDNSSLSIFKFYRNMELIYKGHLNKVEKKIATDRVFALKPNGSWTDLDNVFTYMRDNNRAGTRFFVFSDGMHETETGNKGFVFTEKQIAHILPDAVLSRDTAMPYLYTVRTRSVSQAPIVEEPHSFQPVLLPEPFASAGDELPVALFLIALLLCIGVIRLFTRFRIRIPKCLVKADQEDVSSGNSTALPHGDVFIFSPSFKKQELFVRSVLKKYDFKRKQILKKYNINFADRKEPEPLISDLEYAKLKKQKPYSYLIRELTILNNQYILKHTKHPYSDYTLQEKYAYLEILINYVCLNASLTAVQILYIETLALDFSVSSAVLKTMFDESMKKKPKYCQKRVFELLYSIKSGFDDCINDMIILCYVGYPARRYNRIIGKVYADKGVRKNERRKNRKRAIKAFNAGGVK